MIKPTALRYAASVILVRDTVAGMEVLLLERSGQSGSFSGAHVFPGGKVDLHDADAQYEALYAGHTDAEASDQLKVPRYGLAYWMGAIRECFEEVGILLARDRAGAIVSFAEPAARQRFARHRESLNRGTRTLMEICRDEGLQLATDQLVYFSHWVTPVTVARRFDTRFFVCRAPDAQETVIDYHEAVDQCWLRPADALARGAAGGLQLLFPTIKHLQALAGFEDSTSLLAAARARRDIPRVLPMRVDSGDGAVRLILPGEPGYDTREVAPTHYD